MKDNTKSKKKNTIEFSKVLCALIACALFVYAIYAGLAFYEQVKLYYATVAQAIEAGTEYVNISQPDSGLAITCVTSILASFLTYCLYQFGLKNSLNSNNLAVDDVSGVVSRIACGDASGAINDIVEVNKKNSKSKKKSTTKEVDEENWQEVATG